MAMGGALEARPTTSEATTYTDESLSNDRTYRYQVAAITSLDDEGPRSTIESARPRIVRPGPVTQLLLTPSPGNLQIMVRWDGVSSATSYRIYRDDDASDSDGDTLTALPETSTNTSYTDSSLTHGRTYRYQVAAVNAGGDGTRSAIASVRLVLAQTAITSLTSNGQQIRLGWNRIAGATSYRIYRDDGLGSSLTAHATSSGLTHTDTTRVINGRTYRYRVAGVTSGGAEGVRSDIRLIPHASRRAGHPHDYPRRQRDTDRVATNLRCHPLRNPTRRNPGFQSKRYHHD